MQQEEDGDEDEGDEDTVEEMQLYVALLIKHLMSQQRAGTAMEWSQVVHAALSSNPSAMSQMQELMEGESD